MVKGTEKQTMIYKPQHRGDDYVCFVLDQNAEPNFSSRSRNKPVFVFTFPWRTSSKCHLHILLV